MHPRDICYISSSSDKDPLGMCRGVQVRSDVVFGSLKEHRHVLSITTFLSGLVLDNSPLIATQQGLAVLTSLAHGSSGKDPLGMRRGVHVRVDVTF